MEEGDKGDIRMESGLFIFHISNCLLCLFVCYIKVPGFSWRPTFHCLSLERGEGRRQRKFTWNQNSDVAAYVTSSTHLIFTLNKHNIHLICISSISLLQFIKCTPGGAKVEKQIFVCRQLELVHVSAASLYPGGGDAARVIVNILGIYSRASVICQTNHLVNLWQ